jgi:hypothetical protein
MRNLHSDSEPIRVDNQLAGDPAQNVEGLPNRLLTAREVARFVGCHEETVRRAYWRGLDPRIPPDVPRAAIGVTVAEFLDTY